MDPVLWQNWATVEELQPLGRTLTVYSPRKLIHGSSVGANGVLIWQSRSLYGWVRGLILSTAACANAAQSA
eukprot:3045874-Rhodomonas_salina.1